MISFDKNIYLEVFVGICYYKNVIKKEDDSNGKIYSSQRSLSR